MQCFCHFWSNVQRFALAGAAPKLCQISSIGKSRWIAMKWAIWSMFSFSDLTSGQPLWRQTSKFANTIFFLNFTFFYNNFRTIDPRTTNHTNVFLSLRWIELYYILSKHIQNLTSHPICGHGSGQANVGHMVIIRFEATKQTLWYQFHSSVTFGLNVLGRRVISP